MIQYCTGIPGSGKSYYGIFNIAIHFAKELKDNKKFKSFALSKTKYKTCLTNINELKFDKFDSVKELDFNKFKIILTKLHNLYKLGKSDSELEESVKDEDFFYTLIVFDECHNFLNKDDEVLVWWLSYHRHFFQDIILITQDLPLVNKKYKSFTEFYFKAIPSSRKLFNTSMIYHQFTGHQLFQTQKANTKKLPILKDIFSLYGSGENNKQKSIVVYYLILAFIFTNLLLVISYFFIKSKTQPKTEVQITQPADNINKTVQTQQLPQNQQTNQKQIISTAPADTQNGNLKLFKFSCFDKFCYYKFDNKTTIEIPSNILKTYLLNIDIDKKFTEIVNNRLVIYVLVNEDKFNFLEKGVRNDQENINNLLPMANITQ